MKKYRILLLIVTATVFVGITSILHFKERNQSISFVVFSQYYSEELHKALLHRLEENDIPYQVDEARNVKIPKNDVERAVQCCS